MPEERQLLNYRSPVKSFVVQQLTQSGWVELIRIPIGNDQATPQQIQEALEQLQSLLYDNNKIHLSVQGAAVCVRAIDDNGGTFRVSVSCTPVEEPYVYD
jgi:hypothetical protein